MLQQRKAKSQRMSVAIERANEEALRRALRRSMFERKGVVSTPPPGSLSPRRTQLSAEKAEEMRQQREEYIMQNEHSQSFFGESETGIVGHNVSSNASCYSDASVRSENTVSHPHFSLSCVNTKTKPPKSLAY